MVWHFQGVGIWVDSAELEESRFKSLLTFQRIKWSKRQTILSFLVFFSFFVLLTPSLREHIKDISSSYHMLHSVIIQRDFCNYTVHQGNKAHRFSGKRNFIMQTRCKPLMLSASSLVSFNHFAQQKTILDSAERNKWYGNVDVNRIEHILTELHRWE